MSGRTTRKANELIEELFIRGEIIAVDHEDHDRAHENVLDILISRMKYEHPRHKITINRDERKITLKGFQRGLR